MVNGPPTSRVAVFAPAPQLTITVEDGGDGDDEIHLHAGGQGLWIARLLGELGVPTSFCASFGGETGAVLRALAQQEPIHELIGVEVGACNGAYVHDRRHGDRSQVAGQAAGVLNRHDRDELYTAAVAAGLGARICVLGGYDPSAVPVPPDLYRRLARDLRANGTAVVADLSGELRAAAMEGGLDVLKTSDEDLAEDGLLPADADDAAVIEVMGELRKMGDVDHLVITRSSRPALASGPDGQVVAVQGPTLEVFDHRGAGDSVTAGITAGLFHGAPFHDALRIGVAAASLNVARHGLATGRAEAIASVSDRVQIRPIGADLCPEP